MSFFGAIVAVIASIRLYEDHPTLARVAILVAVWELFGHLLLAGMFAVILEAFRKRPPPGAPRQHQKPLPAGPRLFMNVEGLVSGLLALALLVYSFVA